MAVNKLMQEYKNYVKSYNMIIEKIDDQPYVIFKAPRNGNVCLLLDSRYI